MREDLLGYLLGALEPDEMQRVSDALKADPVLRQQLDELSAALRPLDEAHDLYDAPPDLLSKTLDALPPGLPPETVETEEHTRISGTADLATATQRNRGGRWSAFRLPMGQGGMGGGSVQWSWLDSLVTTAAAVILAGIVLPGILKQRAIARTEACQSQLREAGVGLIQYSNFLGHGRFPQLAPVGPEAFAGVYAVRLNERGLLPGGGTPMWCPSIEPTDELFAVSIPSIEQLYRETPEQLALIQRAAGGHYAYSLGVQDRGLYVAPKYAGRSYFAILSDAPQLTLDGWSMAHDGQGCNILFEDGHVAFVANWDADIAGDHLFLNRKGEVEAGLDVNDVTLGPSSAPPFLPIRAWSR